MCLVANILVPFVETKMTIGSFWTKLGVNSNYIVWHSGSHVYLWQIQTVQRLHLKWPAATVQAWGQDMSLGRAPTAVCPVEDRPKANIPT